MIVLRGAFWAFLVLVTGCGQRGDLYLPDKQTTPVEAPTQSKPKDETKKEK